MYVGVFSFFVLGSGIVFLVFFLIFFLIYGFVFLDLSLCSCCSCSRHT